MRSCVLLAVVVLVPAACGGDQPADRARPTTSSTADVATPPTSVQSVVTPPTTPLDGVPSTPPEVPASTVPDTVPAVTDPPDPPPPPEGGLGDDIIVNDRVTIIVLDPED